MSSTVETATEVRSFDIEVPDEELADLRRCIEATRWLERETVHDQSHGARAAFRSLR